MRRALAVLLLAGCSPVTEVRVSIETAGPTDLSALQVSVTNPDLSPARVYDSQSLPLCQGAGSDRCIRLPASVTLVPGSRDARVRVEVSGFGAGNALVHSQASVFEFIRGVRQTLSFVLYDKCRGQVCAALDQGCNSDGQCEDVAPIGPPQPGKVTRVMVYTGENRAEPFRVTPPSKALPNDLVIVAILNSNGNGSVATAPASWTPLDQVSNGGTHHTYFFRTAGMNEPGDVAGYTFGADSAAIYWMVAVYRGANTVRSLGAEIVGGPYVVSSAMTDQDALIAALLDTDESAGTCSISPPAARQYLSTTWKLFDIPVSAGTPSGDRQITCLNGSPAALLPILISTLIRERLRVQSRRAWR